MWLAFRQSPTEFLADGKRLSRISEICALLGYCVRHCQETLTFEDGTDRLSRNVGEELPLHAA